MSSVENSPDRAGIIITHGHCWADVNVQAIKKTKKIYTAVIMTQVFILLKLENASREGHKSPAK